MTGIKIDGLEVAKNVKQKVSETVKKLSEQGITPCLATILVGNNSASQTYVRNKHKACEEVGIITQDHQPSEDITQKIK
uniref:Methylenetetrahydrofolate dehydrogenase (FolD) n=2 Tax=environmental samples TaxID=651140 RepID=A0A075FXY4_9ARCH|nr:methylenetetrahydrofolate dehydrogenase (folD) [uncultured marine thaumarchaeote AD1000_46_C12]AIE94525.1 methylenetetrahydrofolate dehydrogenase (folD) [uncultured marine thaumarchaeote AD1000_46_F05]